MMRSRSSRPVACIGAALMLLGVPAFAQDETPDPMTRLKKVSLTTEDKVRLSALYLPPADLGVERPALVLLHGGGMYKERWVESGFLARMAAESYHFLAIDIRDRGESEAGDAEALKRDPTLPYRDIEAAFAWLAEQRGVDTARFGLVGSSYGANLATSGVITQGWNVKTVVSLSATAAAYRFLGLHSGRNSIPTGLYLASDDEVARYDAAATAKRLVKDTAGASQLEIYPGKIHALWLFEHNPKVPPVVIDWLRTHL